VRVSDPSRPTSDQIAKPPAAAVGERRYTEEELALILNRAAERQDGAPPSAPRYTLAEIQEIAAGAGIAPDHVATVAASLHDDRGPAGGGLLGAPSRFRFEDSIDGEVTDDVVAELFDLARRELGQQGSVSEALGTMEWKAQGVSGWRHVTVTRRGGRTTIAVSSSHTDALATTATLGGFGAFVGWIGIGTALASAATLPGPLTGIAAIVGGTGGAWLATRAVWRRIARSSASRTTQVGSALLAAARREASDGRVRPGRRDDQS
jgi:hypothetical protein